MSDEFQLDTGNVLANVSTKEIFRWDADGKLVYVHPTIVEEVNKHVDVHTLEVSALLASMQRTCLDLDARILKLEQECAELRAKLGAIIDKPTTSEVAPQVVPFESVDNLVKTVESMFECRDGDHRAWHSGWNKERNDWEMYPYVVLSVIAHAALPNAPERLRQTLYTALFKLKQTCTSERPVLYWRYAKEERIQEERYAGPGIETLYKIRTRIAIPEADFSVAGAVVKSDEGAALRL